MTTPAEQLQIDDDESREYRAKRFQKFLDVLEATKGAAGGLVMNPLSGQVWADLRDVWICGAFVATVILADIYIEQQIRGLLEDFVPPAARKRGHQAILQAAEGLGVIKPATAKAVKKLHEFRRYYESPFHSAWSGTPPRRDKKPDEFLSDLLGAL